MEQTHGTWGERIVTRVTGESVTAILLLKPWKRCSWHSHKTTYNQFFVISGELGVKTDIGPNNQSSLTRLTAKQVFTVRPGVMHEFQTYETGAVVEEIAYVKYDEADIHRLQLGGDILPK